MLKVPSLTPTMIRESTESLSTIPFSDKKNRFRVLPKMTICEIPSRTSAMWKGCAICTEPIYTETFGIWTIPPMRTSVYCRALPCRWSRFWKRVQVATIRPRRRASNWKVLLLQLSIEVKLWDVLWRPCWPTMVPLSTRLISIAFTCSREAACTSVRKLLNLVFAR